MYTELSFAVLLYYKKRHLKRTDRDYFDKTIIPARLWFTYKTLIIL